MRDKKKAWNTLRELGVSEETLQIVTSINGYTFETLESILYAALGYESFDQIGRWAGVKA